MEDKLNRLLEITADSIVDLLYYDRKECEEISRDDVDKMISSGILTADKLKEAFSSAIDEAFNDEWFILDTNNYYSIYIISFTYRGWIDYTKYS